jgi:hypothetical protein
VEESPKTAPYGMVAVFEDVYGNLCDLVEPHEDGVGKFTLVAYVNLPTPSQMGCTLSRKTTDYWDYLSYAYRSYENYAVIVSVNLRLLKRMRSKIYG